MQVLALSQLNVSKWVNLTLFKFLGAIRARVEVIKPKEPSKATHGHKKIANPQAKPCDGSKNASRGESLNRVTCTKFQNLNRNLKSCMITCSFFSSTHERENKKLSWGTYPQSLKNNPVVKPNEKAETKLEHIFPGIQCLTHPRRL